MISISWNNRPLHVYSVIDRGIALRDIPKRKTKNHYIYVLLGVTTIITSEERILFLEMEYQWQLQDLQNSFSWNQNTLNISWPCVFCFLFNNRCDPSLVKTEHIIELIMLWLYSRYVLCFWLSLPITSIVADVYFIFERDWRNGLVYIKFYVTGLRPQCFYASYTCSGRCLITLHVFCNDLTLTISAKLKYWLQITNVQKLQIFS